ncbi:MAG: PAS domain S-box protein [Desulfobulbaceae bacterium]|nr:PAS domain S-box protein [Desulfobulbaceae bacterium]
MENKDMNEFASFINSILDDFNMVNLSDLDQGIERVLGELGNFVGVDGVYLFLVDEKRQIMTNTNQWRAAGIAPRKDNLQELPVAMFPWWMGKLVENGHIHIPQVAVLPTEALSEKRFLQDQGICSLLAVSLNKNDHVLGFVVFDAVTEEVQWQEKDIILLKIAASVFISNVLRSRREKKQAILENKFSLLYNEAPLPYHSLDSNGNILFVNNEYVKILGYEKDELIGSWFGDFLTAEARETFPAIYKQFLAAGEASGIVWPVVAKSGVTIVFSLHGKVICDSNGKVLHTHCILQNISEQKRAEAKLEFTTKLLETQLESSLDGILVITGEGKKILLCNQRFIDMWGLPAHLVEAGDDEQCRLFAEKQVADPIFFKKQAAMLISNPEMHIQDEIVLRDGRVFSFFSSPLTVNNGKIEARISFFRDVTKEKKATEILQSHKRKLEKKVFEKNQNLQKTIAALHQEFLERKELEAKALRSAQLSALGTLSAGVAHEISNPNSLIILNIPLLRDIFNDMLQQFSSLDNAKQIQFGGLQYDEVLEITPGLLDGIAQGAERIDFIVRHLRDFSRQDDDDFPVTVSINKLADNALLFLSSLLKKKRIKVTKKFTGNPSVPANEAKVEQVLINLIKNSIEAVSDSDGEIVLVCQNDEGQHDVVFEVRDNGCGMAPGTLERLCEPFFTTKQKEGGCGLGLWSSYSLVKEMKGELLFTSTEGEETVASLRMKRSPVK